MKRKSRSWKMKTKEKILKTVRDLRYFDIGVKLENKSIIVGISLEELKAEAVKWIKEDRGLRKDNTIWRINQDELLDLLEDRWIKRFNITEVGK